MIEVARHADPFGIWRPDGEMNSLEALVSTHVGTQPLKVAKMGSFSQKVKVEIRQYRAELIGIDKLPLVPLVILDLEPVHDGPRSVVEDGLEKPVGVQPLHRNKRTRLAAHQVDHPGSAPLGQERPNHPIFQSVRAPRYLMRTQNRERVPMTRMNRQFNVGLRCDRRLFCHQSHDR